MGWACAGTLSSPASLRCPPLLLLLPVVEGAGVACLLKALLLSRAACSRALVSPEGARGARGARVWRLGKGCACCC